MASWKKVIVSGSIAELSAVSASAVYIQGGQLLTAPASTTISGSFSGSFAGNGANITGVVTASYAVTASYVQNAQSASYVSTAQTASYVLTAQTASYVLSSSYAATASFANNFTVAGTLTAQTIVVQTISSSVAYDSGSNRFGSLSSNTQTFTGSVGITGSLSVTQGVVNQLTASYASNADLLDGLNSTVFATTGSNIFIGNQTITGSLNITGSITGTPGVVNQLTSSYAVTASYIASAATLANALTLGTGLIGTSYNGSVAVTTAISGAAALTNGNVPKWTGTGFNNSNISDSGTQIQIGAGASGGVTVAAGGVNVTGNSTFNNDLTVIGNLTVNGSATLVNSTNTYIKDQFLQIASGSTTLVDAGIIAQYNAAGSGSAFFLESSAAGTYGRWAVAYDLLGTVTSAAADEYLVTTKINASAPGAAIPTWGGATNGVGNMWVTTAGDIYIYS
jgi:hypothetical protein